VPPDVKEVACRGRCCRRLPISVPYSELLADYETWRRGGEYRFRDVDMIGQMLVPLGWSRIGADGRILAECRQMFSCKYLVGGLCSVYERRPDMCSSYPYDGGCDHWRCPSQPWYRRLLWWWRMPWSLFLLAEGAVKEWREWEWGVDLTKQGT